MTEKHAQTLASWLIGAAVAGAGVFVLRRPGLRRMAWQLTRTMVLTTAPAWVAAEAARGWRDSERLAGREQGDMIAG